MLRKHRGYLKLKKNTHYILKRVKQMHMDRQLLLGATYATVFTHLGCIYKHYCISVRARVLLARFCLW